MFRQQFLVAVVSSRAVCVLEGNGGCSSRCESKKGQCVSVGLRVCVCAAADCVCVCEREL